MDVLSFYKIYLECYSLSMLEIKPYLRLQNSHRYEEIEWRNRTQIFYKLQRNSEFIGVSPAINSNETTTLKTPNYYIWGLIIAILWTFHQTDYHCNLFFL